MRHRAGNNAFLARCSGAAAVASDVIKDAGAALSVKCGNTTKRGTNGASRSMTEEQLKDFAETQRKGKPEHKSEF